MAAKPRDGLLVDGRSARERQLCQTKACEIQSCLAKHSYEPERCKAEMEAHRACVVEANALPASTALREKR